MHVEPPKGSILSLKEFGFHYLMIVLSILTALGLEEALQLHHNKESAQTAEESIERELRTNLADLREAVKSNRDRLAEMNSLGDQASAAIRQGGNPADLQKKIVGELLPKFTVGLLLPSQSREAWDVAVASQAATHIPRERLTAYTAAYSIERDALVGANSGMLMLDAPRMIDMKADAEIGPVDPKRFLEMTRESAAVNSTGLNNLIAAEQEMMKVLDQAGIHAN